MEQLVARIENGVPVENVSKHSMKYGVLDSMQVGESFLVPAGANLGGLLASCQYRRKVYGRKYAKRTTTQGIRIWRVS
jgi:hypothetical protein